MKRWKAKSCQECYLHNPEVPKSPLLQNPPLHFGASHPKWKGGGNLYWKRQVLKRDNWTCKNCGLYEPSIVEVAHIEPLSRLKKPKGSGRVSLEDTGWYKRKYEVGNPFNMIVLCPNCHARFDKGLLKDTGHLKPS